MKYKVNFKSLSTKQKIEYIWDYYKWHMVILIFVISIIVSTVQKSINYKSCIKIDGTCKRDYYHRCLWR